jgi:hypothetical protein
VLGLEFCLVSLNLFWRRINSFLVPVTRPWRQTILRHEPRELRRAQAKPVGHVNASQRVIGPQGKQTRHVYWPDYFHEVTPLQAA